MKLIPALCLAAASLPLCSCSTTGDPTEGGLLGWSPAKFDQRIYEKERTLDAVERDTRYQNRTASGLRSDIQEERQTLRRYE